MDRQNTKKLWSIDVKRIVSDRLDAKGEEEYLVQWEAEPTDYPPLSWHTVDELSPCLDFLQEYLEEKPNLLKSRKRKSPDTNLRIISFPLSRVAVNQPKVFNGRDASIVGFIKIKKASGSDITCLHINDVPRPRVIPPSDTTQAATRIRAEFLRRLHQLDGPPITLINYRDDTSPSLRFAFIQKCNLSSKVHKASPDTLLGCTKCSPHMGRSIGCEYTRKCDCLEYAAVDIKRLDSEQRALYKAMEASGDVDTRGLPKRFPYFTTPGKIGLLVSFYLDSRNPIYECNDLCNCGPNCRNRNVQFGRRVELQIFKTKSRGWGLRCTKALRAGEFIDTYRGEIITDREAERRERAGGRQKNSYMYSLDKFAGEQGIEQSDIYVIDGQYQGGPTRFMNHSCDPNCRQYTVSTNKHDFRVYDIAFFACRDIEANEELTFDYLDRDEEDADEEDEGKKKEEEDGESEAKVPCLCGAKNCRKWLWM